MADLFNPNLPDDLLEKLLAVEATKLETRQPLQSTNLYDQTLPMQSMDPDREYIYPGHAEPNENIKHPISGEVLDDRPKVLLRVAGAVDFAGKVRPHYAMIHGFGHQTDVYHTFPKSHWTEAEADSFHGQMTAHPIWTKPNPQPKKRVHLPDLIKEAQARVKAGQASGKLV